MAVTRLSFIVHGQLLVSELTKNVIGVPTAMIPRMKQSAVSYNAHEDIYWTIYLKHKRDCTNPKTAQLEKIQVLHSFKFS